MKRVFILQIFLFIVVFNNAQTFEKIIKTDYDEIVYDAMTINETEVVFAYNYGEAEINYQSKLYKVNWHNGQLTDSVDIPFSYYDEYTFEGIRQVLKYNDTMFLAVGQAINIETQDYQLYIIQFDTLLNILYNSLTGSINKSDKYWDYIINTTGELVCIGQVLNFKFNKKASLNVESILVNNEFTSDRNRSSKNDPSNNILLWISDVYGNEIERKLYSHPANFASTIIEIPEENKYHLVRFFDNDHSFDILDKESLEIDTIIEYPLGFYPRISVNGLSDSLHYLVGRQTMPGGNNKYLSYLEVNKDGSTGDQHILNSDSSIYYPFKTFDLNNTNIYFSGVIPFTYAPPILYPERRWILLYKLSLDGDVIWQKFFKGEANYVPYKLMTTPDDGVLIFSAKYDWNDPIPNQRDVHILKIDSNGNYVPIGLKEPLLNKHQILAYPNPTKNKVNFSFGLYSDLNIDIYDIHGRKVFSEFFSHSPIVNLNHLSSGVYIYSITNNRGFIEKGKLIKE